MPWHICIARHNHLYSPIEYSTLRKEFFLDLKIQWCVCFVELFWHHLFLCHYTKKEWNTAWYVHEYGAGAVSGYVVTLKFFNTIPSIDTNILLPYYSDLIWCAKLDTTIQNNHDTKKYIATVYDGLMLHKMCCHSDLSLECAHVGG